MATARVIASHVPADAVRVDRRRVMMRAQPPGPRSQADCGGRLGRRSHVPDYVALDGSLNRCT
jgi:hypothetical protein